MRNKVDRIQLNGSYDVGGGCEMHLPWASPIFVKSNLGTKEINNTLDAFGRDIYKEIYNPKGSFSHKTVNPPMETMVKTPEQLAAVEWLRSEVIELAEQYVYAHGGDLEDLVLECKTSINLQHSNCSVREHLHICSDLVAVYYPGVNVDMEGEIPHAGSLVFTDPRPVRSMYLLNTELDSRVIAPETGTLVIFPAHLRHSTIHYKNPDNSRLAITNDLVVKSRKYHLAQG
ncbi:putative 2OG-Fe(II) oxygenase [bacterium]|nr:putative 2OG-Fe(II) oxygenase [bacterium]